MTCLYVGLIWRRVPFRVQLQPMVVLWEGRVRQCPAGNPAGPKHYPIWWTVQVWDHGHLPVRHPRKALQAGAWIAQLLQAVCSAFQLSSGRACYQEGKEWYWDRLQYRRTVLPKFKAPFSFSSRRKVAWAKQQRPVLGRVSCVWLVDGRQRTRPSG